MPRLSMRKSSKKLRIKNSVKRSKVTNGKSRGKSKKVTKKTKTKTKRQRGSGNNNENVPGNAPVNAPEEKSPLQLQELIDMFFEAKIKEGTQDRELPYIYKAFVLQLGTYIRDNNQKPDDILEKLFTEVTPDQNPLLDEQLDDNYKSKMDALIEHANGVIEENDFIKASLKHYKQKLEITKEIDKLKEEEEKKIREIEFNDSQKEYEEKQKANAEKQKTNAEIQESERIIQELKRQKQVLERQKQELKRQIKGLESLILVLNNTITAEINKFNTNIPMWNPAVLKSFVVRDFPESGISEFSEDNNEKMKLFAQLPFVRKLVYSLVNYYKPLRNINKFINELLDIFDKVMINPLSEPKPEPEREPRRGILARFGFRKKT